MGKLGRTAWACVRLCAIGLCLAAPSMAQQEGKDPIDRWLDKALDAHPSTAGQRNAVHQARARWDAEMNRAYRKLMARLDAKQQDALRQSQRAWVSFRDAEFRAAEAIVGGKQGTMWLVTMDEKCMEVVKQRALWLRDYDRLVDE